MKRGVYDTIDRAILRELRKDSRRHILEYSAAAAIPKSTVHERLRKLVSDGVRCTPLLNWQYLGHGICVLFIVPFDQKLLDHPCVNVAQQLAPNLLLLECLFATMRAVEEFKEQLAFARYFTVIEVLKKEGFSLEI